MLSPMQEQILTDIIEKNREEIMLYNIYFSPTGGTKKAADILAEGADITIVTHGVLVNEALEAVDRLRAEGIHAELVKLNVLRPLDSAAVRTSLSKTGRLLAVEECCRAGSMGTQLLSAAAEQGIPLRTARRLDLGSGIVEHGSVAALRRKLGIDADGIARAVKEMLHEESKT